MYLDQTNNGISFHEEIASSEGASFILLPEPQHTPENIKAAKREIRMNRDVVSIHVATDSDRDNFYIKEIFRQHECRSLRWFQILVEEKLIRKERLKGTTPHDYVLTHVLPNVSETQEVNYKKYGE